MNINLLAEQIRQQISEGSDILKSNSATDSYVYAHLRQNQDLCKIMETSREKLMPELTKWIIKKWPEEIHTIVQIGRYLKPVQDINTMLHWKNFSNDVLVPDGGQRMEDIRMPIDEFKKELLEKIFKAEVPNH